MYISKKIDKLDLGKKPYFLPVVDYSTPELLWRNPTILISYLFNPFTSPMPVNRNKQLLFAESGGFLTNPPKWPRYCMKNQLCKLPDLVLSLDRPTKKDPEKMSFEVKKHCVQESIDNAYYALEIRDEIMSEWGITFDIVAVIQAYDVHSLIYCTEILTEMDFGFYAFGALPTKGRSTIDKERAWKWVQIVREIIGKKAWLHLLGVMDINLLIELKEFITSFDAASITRLASYGKMYLMDHPELEIKPIDIYKELKIESYKIYTRICELKLWNENST